MSVVMQHALVGVRREHGKLKRFREQSGKDECLCEEDYLSGHWARKDSKTYCWMRQGRTARHTADGMRGAVRTDASPGDRGAERETP